MFLDEEEILRAQVLVAVGGVRVDAAASIVNATDDFSGCSALNSIFPENSEKRPRTFVTR